MGIKGAGDGGKGGGNMGRGGGGREILGAGLYQNLLYFTDFTLFLCTSMNYFYVLQWFTLNLFTSDFGVSLVDYFPLIPKVHKIAVVGGNPHF